MTCLRHDEVELLVRRTTHSASWWFVVCVRCLFFCAKFRALQLVRAMILEFDPLVSLSNSKQIDSNNTSGD